jgi:ArsR family transcriptional regulator, arsenate/arsenite/antimonite-responsive transcriptional repressor
MSLKMAMRMSRGSVLRDNIYAKAHAIADDIFGRTETLSQRRNDLLSLESAFKALGDTTRLRIAHLLDRGEVCVCHVHEALGLSQPKVSRHLAYLRRAGLVRTRRSGRWIYYRLSPAGMSPLVQRILDATAETLHELAPCAIDRRRLAARCEAPGKTTRRPVAR